MGKNEEDSKLNSEGGSFADPAEEEAKRLEDEARAKLEQAKKVRATASKSEKTQPDPTEENPANAALFAKIDAIVEALNQRNSHLCRIADAVEKIERKMPPNALNFSGRVVESPEKSKSESKPSKPSSSGSIQYTEKAQNLFEPALENLLSFEETTEYIVIKPRRYLGSENFAKIAAVVRDAGGEYISAGKESHFRIPKDKLDEM